jgi:hypothetical protein
MWPSGLASLYCVGPDARIDREYPITCGVVDEGLGVDFSLLCSDIRFEINDENMRDLAHLSDKYIIDALQRDIRVSSLQRDFLTSLELCVADCIAKS